MSLFNRTYTFTDGTTAYGSQVEAEIGNIVSVLNNLNTAATNWGLISVLHATSVPLVADCSSGTQDIADFKNNNVIKASISSAGVITATGATMSGAIAMGANKITGLANGSASSDAAAFGQIPTTPISIANGGTASTTGKGLILQTLTVSTTSDSTTTSSSYADVSGLSQAITAAATGNKIRLRVSLNLAAEPASNSTTSGSFQIVKDGTTVVKDFGTVIEAASTTGGTLLSLVQITVEWDDTPADTSAHTYKIQWKRGVGGTLELNGGGGTSYLKIDELGQ